MIRFLMVGIVLGLFGCTGSGIPKDILPPETMQAVYWDYLRADIMANEYVTRDSSKNDSLENAKLQLQVFKIHKITKEEFYKSYEYYLNHQALMKDMLDTMLVRNKDKAKKDSLPIKTRDSLNFSPRNRILDSVKIAL